MSRRLAALVIIVSTLGTACSSTSDDAAPVTESTPATDPPPTSPTTVAPPTTESPTTTSSTTTTLAPTTTTDPTAETEAAVKQAFLDLDAAYLAAAADPNNVDLRNKYRTFFASGNFESQEAFLDRLVADGTSLRLGTEVERSASFPAPVEVLSETEAAITICEVDSDVIRVAGTSTEPEIIVDDRVVTRLTRSIFVLENDRWVLQSGVILERWEGLRPSCVD